MDNDRQVNKMHWTDKMGETPRNRGFQGYDKSTYSSTTAEPVFFSEDVLKSTLSATEKTVCTPIVPPF